MSTLAEAPRPAVAARTSLHDRTTARHSAVEISALVATGIVVLRPVTAVWSTQPTYAYGWGIPILAAYLFYQRTRVCPPAHAPTFSGALLQGVLFPWATALLTTLLLLEVVPDWRPALGFITGLYSIAIAAWCWLRGGVNWVRHFAFPCTFLLLGAPWPYQFETAFIQGLARLNAALVADSLVLSDLPVRAAGNTILTSAGPLGIEQACSGISSLQASVVISFFLGEFYQLRWQRRAVLCALAALCAFLGNYARLLFLAWSAEQSGLSKMESAHDLAGFGILIFTLAGCWAAALLFRPRFAHAGAGQASSSPIQITLPNRAAYRWAVGVLGAAIMSESLVLGWFGWREPPPAWIWRVHLPAPMTAGLRSVAIPAATHELLGDSEGNAEEWRDARGWAWQMFWFRYPGQTASRLSVELHTPEVCLPAAGQREITHMPVFCWRRGSLTLPVQPYLFTAAGGPRYVFWIVDRADSSMVATDSRAVIYGEGLPAFLARVQLWARDAWRGVRAEPSESLEVTMAGPFDYPQARDALVRFLDEAIEPSGRPSPSAGSH